MLKAYIVAFIVCFIITVLVMAAVVLVDTQEWNREQGDGEGRKPVMEKKDRMLMPLRIAVVSAVVSIPAPLTLAFYAMMTAAAFLTGLSRN